MPRPDSLDPAKARRAAADPRRPGEDCRAPAGSYRVAVDPSRCEGKGDCVAVCPYSVFKIGRIPDDVFASLGFLGKLKSRAHGRKFALTPNLSACHACGLCVVACPEDAIALVK
ncbi:MAG TPA: ferredoxin family protein [Kofleriaceae bacterium]|jgi:NAD-dependent dihydropyrimidine dehydrogenase PreA subunit